MIRVNRWTATALSATFLLLALLIAGVRIVRAEPAAVEITVSETTPSGPSDRSPTATGNPTVEIHKPIAGRNFVIVPFTTELQAPPTGSMVKPSCSFSLTESRC